MTMRPLNSSDFTPRLKEALEIVAGLRGSRALWAVRFGDIADIRVNAYQATQAAARAAEDTATLTGVVATLDTELTQTIQDAQADAAAAIAAAAAADQAAAAVQADHDALVAGFLDGTLLAAFDAATAARDTLRTDLEAQIETIGASSIATNGVGWQIATDSDAVGTAGAAVTAATGAATLGQTGTLLLTEGATARDTSATTNGYALEIPIAQALQFASRRVKISVLAKQPAATPATRFGVAYSTNENGSSGYLVADKDLTTVWQWFNFYYDVADLIAGGTDWLGLYGDDSKTGLTTEIARIVVQVSSEAADLPIITDLQADITDMLALDANALTGTVMGVMLSELAVDANGLIAGVQNFGSAMADVLGNASASYVMRVKAGGAAGEIEMVAFEDAETGAAASAVRISADDILLDGSVRMRKLVVTDNTNLFLDGNFAELTTADLYISNVGSGYGASVRADPGLYETGGTNIRVDRIAPATNPEVLVSLANPIFWAKVAPFTTYYVEGRCRTGGTFAPDGFSFRILWYDEAGGYITYSDVIPYDSALLGTYTTYSGQVVSPAGAVSASWEFGNLTTNTLVLYYHFDRVLMQRANGAEVTVDGSITAEKMSVTELSAITGTLGLFQSAASGARVEIQDDKITVYRADGSVAVKIGNLA